MTCLFHKDTNTAQYLVADPESKQCAIVDSVMDFDPASGKLNTKSADEIVDVVRMKDFSVAWILETHAHADHLTSSQYLKRIFRAPIAIGENISHVQRHFALIFNLPESTVHSGLFDKLWKDNDRFAIGNLQVRVMHTPGHTPSCVSYVVGENDSVFVGDTVFMPDFGTARTDFPGGSAPTLYRFVFASRCAAVVFRFLFPT